MVTKHSRQLYLYRFRFILAKNHMVTKHCICNKKRDTCLILAKNHMVTKHQKVHDLS